MSGNTDYGRFTRQDLVDATLRGYGIMRRLNPELLRNVEIRKLDMASPCRCILGQAYGSYSEGMSKIEVDREAAADFANRDKTLFQSPGTYFGFDAPGGNGAVPLRNSYELLQELWAGLLRLSVPPPRD